MHCPSFYFGWPFGASVEAAPCQSTESAARRPPRGGRPQLGACAKSRGRRVGDVRCGPCLYRIDWSVRDRVWPEHEQRSQPVGITTAARARVVKGGVVANARGAARAPRSSTRPPRARRTEARRALPNAASRRSAAAHLVHTPAARTSCEGRPARLARPPYHSQSGPWWTRIVHRRATVCLRAEQAQTNFCATIWPRPGPLQAPDFVSDAFPVRGVELPRGVTPSRTEAACSRTGERRVAQGCDPVEDQCSA